MWTNLSVVNASQTDTQLPEQCHCVLATVVHHLDHSRIFQDSPKPRDKYNIRVGKNVEYHRWEPVDFDLDERQMTVLGEVALDVDSHQRIDCTTHSLLVQGVTHTLHRCIGLTGILHVRERAWRRRALLRSC